LLHATLQREVVGGHSLLYTWAGTDPKAKPIALLAHQDVVPVAPGTDALWKKPPFSGLIEDGFVWGRGTLDDKSNLITQLETVEMLVKSGFKPQRSVYLAFGHDERSGRAPRCGADRGPAPAARRATRVRDRRGLGIDRGSAGRREGPPVALIGMRVSGVGEADVDAAHSPHAVQRERRQTQL
jgi:carboxypeptidase PM20D1